MTIPGNSLRDYLYKQEFLHPGIELSKNDHVY
jgi:hypothetical protein